ncbi:MAG: cyclase family protein [Conexivisphaerales archaeon]
MSYNLIDLSMPIISLNTPVFPGYPEPLKAVYTTVRDNGFFSNIWILVEHTATHVDSPAHFIEDGNTIDKIPVERFIAKGIVLDFSNVNAGYEINSRDLYNKIKELNMDSEVGDGWIILFYTGYTEKAGTAKWMEHPVLREDACDAIINMGVNAIGIDAPSPDKEPFAAHKKLLSSGILIYENLNNLGLLLSKRFTFLGIPLYLSGASASPVRAVAVLEKEF